MRFVHYSDDRALSVPAAIVPAAPVVDELVLSVQALDMPTAAQILDWQRHLGPIEASGLGVSQWVAYGAVAEISASGPSRFVDIRTAAQRLFSTIQVEGDAQVLPRMVGGFSFFDHLRKGSPWSRFKAARFVLPRHLLLIEDGQATLASISGSSAKGARARIGGAGDFGVPAGEDGMTNFIDYVDTIRAAITRGDVQKVVAARSRTFQCAGANDHERLLRSLIAREEDELQSSTKFWFKAGERAFFGETPERLVRVRGVDVETEALAGTLRREEGESPDALMMRVKDQSEHRFVRDAIVQSLSEYCDAVAAQSTFVTTHGALSHLRTPIGAQLRQGAHILDLVATLHPTPAVGGVPKVDALSMIKANEGFERGWYASPVGWFDARGQGEFHVALRSGLYASTEGMATLFAGAGIVSGSIARDEFLETEAKLEPARLRLESALVGSRDA